MVEEGALLRALPKEKGTGKSLEKGEGERNDNTLNFSVHEEQGRGVERMLC